MDLRYFFEGQQGKEIVASAWLATLLEYDRDFRAAVFAKIPGALDPDASWEVAIETPLDGYCDVTLASPGTFVLIENKIVGSARRDRQFVTYYEAAARLHPNDRVIGVYLGPTANTGTDEVGRVLECDDYGRRNVGERPDQVAPLGQKDDLAGIVAGFADDPAQFRDTGFRSVIDHIARIEKGRDPDSNRDRLREIIADARLDLQGRYGDRVTLARWASIGQEALFTVKAPVTMLLTLDQEEDKEPPNAIHGVFDGDRITLDVGMSLGPSSSGKKDPALMARWRRATVGTLVAIDGLDIEALPVVSRGRLATDVPFKGTRAGLVDLLVARGVALLDFALAVAADE